MADRSNGGEENRLSRLVRSDLQIIYAFYKMLIIVLVSQISPPGLDSLLLVIHLL